MIALSLPEDSDKVNFVGLMVENGDFKFHLMSYNTKSDKPVTEKIFVGEYPLKLYSTKNEMCLLTDKALHFIDYNGEIIKSYDHGAEKLSGFYQCGDYIALTYTRSVSDAGTIRIFTTKGKEIAVQSFENNMISFSAYKDTLYALEKGKLHIMQRDATGTKIREDSVKTVETDGINDGVFATADNEYVLVSPFGAQQISG